MMFRLQKISPARCTKSYVQQIKETHQKLSDITEQIELHCQNVESQSGGPVKKIFLDCKLQRIGERTQVQLTELKTKFETLLRTLPSLTDEQFEPSLWGCRRLRNVQKGVAKCQSVWLTALKDHQEGLSTPSRKVTHWSW